MSSLPLLFTGEDLTKQLHQHIPNLDTPHPDIIWCNKAEEGIDVELMRSLETHFLMPPYQSKEKILILHRLDLANEVVQNMLLKKLEEPPTWMQLILTASHPNLLLPTLLSRVERQFTRPTFMADKPKKLGGTTSLFSLSINEKIQLAEQFKERSVAIDTVIEWLNQEVQNLQKEPSLTTTANIRRLQQAIIYLQANTNVRLVMEWCLFGLK